MVPAWVSKFKDLKAVSKSKLKQSKAPYLPGLHAGLLASSDADGSIFFAEPLSVKDCNSRSYSSCFSVSRDADEAIYFAEPLSLKEDISPDADGFVYFAEPISLKGGSSRSYSVHIGPGRSFNTDIYTDEASRMQPCILSSADGNAAARNSCRHGSKDWINSTEVRLHSAGYGEFEHKFFALSSCDMMAGPLLLEDKGRMVTCVQDDMYALLRNEAESSVVLTPNTMDSSFGSESSSMDSSSMAHVRGYAGEGRQAGLVLVQDGDDSFGLGSHGSCRETSVYPEEADFFSPWQRSSLLEEFQDGVTSYDMEVIPRSSYDRGAPSRMKIRSQNGDGVSIVDMGLILGKTSNEAKGCKHWKTSHSHHATELHSLSVLTELHSLASDIRKDRNVTEFQSLSELHSLSADFRKDGNMLESPGISCMPHTSWEERCARIAVENPGLMESSRWQESACALQSSDMEITADQDCDPPTGYGDGTPVSAEQDDTDAMPVSAQQDETDGLSTSARQDPGNEAGHHESMYKAYVERGRRRRRSSFSAALPEDLQGVVGDSVALVKMSSDPYEDFRHSMYEMIMDKDLEESMDVEELLYCYLSLNSPEHHELIKEVFSDVWSAILMSVR